MAPSRSTIGGSIENAEIIDLVSSDDEENEPAADSSAAATVASSSGKRRRGDTGTPFPENRAAKKKLTHSTEHVQQQQQQQQSTCMPFITGDVLDSAVCTSDLMPLLHRLSLPHRIFCSGRKHSTPTTTTCSLLHIRQTDKWSCGFRSAQVMLTAVLPLLTQHHAFYTVSSLHGSYYYPHSREQNRPIPIPCLHQLQVFLEHSWKEGFDPRGAQHYSHEIIGKCKEIGAVEVSTILSYLHLDSCVVQFIKIATSRNMLGPFVWQYFSQHGPCFQCGGTKNHAAAVQTSCTNWALQLLQDVSSQQQNGHPSEHDDMCSCPLVPLYLQWQGHSVCIVGIEKKKDDFDLLLFDPMKRGQVLRESLLDDNSKAAKDVLKPMRMSVASLAKRDLQILMGSPRELSREEQSAILHSGGNVVTAAAAAVLQFRQEQQQQQHTMSI